MSTLKFYNPRRDHTVELEEHQTVQQDALERIGYHLVTGEEEQAEPDLLDLSIPELEERLAAIDDVTELTALYEAEEDGQRRKGALSAIATRIHDLSESEGEADGDDEPEEGESDPEGDVEDAADAESEGEADGDDEG